MAFTKPDIYNKPLLFQYRTNNAPFENSYTIKDESGNIVKVGGGFTLNTVYYDTLNLIDGCYSLEWLDSGQDGIAWWANNDGTGYVWLRELGGSTKVFEPDYGAFIKYNFVLNNTVGIDENESNVEINLYPNPSDDIFNITVNGYQKGDMQYDVFSPIGHIILSDIMIANNSYAEATIDLSTYSTGIYFLRIKTGDSYSYKRLIRN
ncbi:MAG: T9SS type A sorting domain-containing protein [Bacteroidia bacterium]|nr:T9SS type A sorting domain-containing protein [Bacteroidia bacterium]